MDAEDPLINQVVSGRYRVIKPLGEGGMGQVYLALHEAIEKKIALKVLRPEYGAKEDIVSRFQQEAISASRIKHPNVLEVFDFGTLDNGCAYLAMEFLSGNDIADELSERGYLETSRAIRIMLQVCKALAAAHKAGVVHRDMKPDNIFLVKSDDGDELVKIVDFGIAQLRATNEQEAKSEKPRRRLTKTGMIFGTPEYMAPEQAAGKKADQRVDIYACGIILFEMLTGAVPFTGDSFMAVLAAHLNDPAPSMLTYRPDLMVSQELHNIVSRALAKDPNDRFQSMGEFMAAVLATPEGNVVSHMGDYQPVSHFPPPPTGTALSLGQHGAHPQGTAAQFNIHAKNATRSAPTTVVPVLQGAGSHTLDAATAAGTNPPRKRSSALGIGLGVVAVLIAGGAAAFVMVPKLNGQNLEGVPAPPTTEAPVVATTPPLPTPAPTPSATPVVAVAEVAAQVTLSIETTPAGALLQMDGAQVCAATPCELKVAPGETVDLRAQLGALRGVVKVNAQADQTVTIPLRAPAKPKAQPSRLCEVDVGGLKVLRPCKQ
ncbi:MAG: hypothetical protein RJA70_623 [Pseudomonadota bacterium]|jgi:serine/threonine-protein kinase